jgi:phosphatidylglycerol:prolipoprotein diacylglycerol transferase
MNYYGGVVGAAIAMLIYLRRKKQDLLEWADLLIAGIPLAHTFGRIGNFINGELYGRLTTAPWGMVFKESDSFPPGVPIGDPAVKKIADQVGIAIPDKQPTILLPRHPTQIYEMIFECLMIWAILWFIFRNRKPFKGFIAGLYVALYGFVRFIIDYFRMPLRDEFLLKLGPQQNPPYLLLSPFNFTLDQLFSFSMFIGGLIILFILWKRSKRGTIVSEEHSKFSFRKLRKKIDKE